MRERLLTNSRYLRLSLRGAHCATKQSRHCYQIASHKTLAMTSAKYVSASNSGVNFGASGAGEALNRWPPSLSGTARVLSPSWLLSKIIALGGEGNKYRSFH